MEVSTKELRIQPGKIIEQVSIGQEITITYRGKPLARIVPFESPATAHDDSTIFGMWNDRVDSQSVEDLVRDLRQGRRF